MATGVPEFSYFGNRAQVQAGFKGGSFFKKPAPLPAISITQCPPEVSAKFEAEPTPSGMPGDPWNYKRVPGAGM